MVFWKNIGKPLKNLFRFPILTAGSMIIFYLVGVALLISLITKKRKKIHLITTQDTVFDYTYKKGIGQCHSGRVEDAGSA